MTAKVRRWSTIRVVNRSYSVPARLIGERVRVLLHHDHLEVYFAGKLAERLPRIRGQRPARIDYHHVIWSLARKPGAFARYRWREELFPSLIFRRAYDLLRSFHGELADSEYVPIPKWQRAAARRWWNDPCASCLKGWNGSTPSPVDRTTQP